MGGLRQIALAALLTATGACRFGFLASEGHDSDAAHPDGDGDGAASDDATIGDGPGIDGAAACAADICDGFEGQLDTSVWTAFGTVTADTTQFHRGAASIKMHVNARTAGQSGYSTLTETRTFATGTPASLYVRAWLRFGSLPAGSNGMELFTALQSQAPDEGVYLFLHNGDLGLFDQFSNNSNDNSTTPPVNTWFCVIWHVAFTTASTGSMSMTSDVAPSLMMSNIPTDSSPPVKELVLGAGFASGNVNVAQPAFDMWIDDVLVDTAALTCAQ